MSNLISSILVIAALGLTFGYTMPTYRGTTTGGDFSDKSVKELLEEKNRYVTALQRTREIEEVRGGLLTKYNSITESDRKKLDKILPETVDAVRLIIDLSSIANSYGMQLRGISIAEAQPQAVRKDTISAASSKMYSSVDVGFTVVGSYDKLVSFLSDLEKNLRVTDITRFSLHSDAVSTGLSSGQTKKTQSLQSTYSMQVSAKTYYLVSK